MQFAVPAFLLITLVVLTVPLSNAASQLLLKIAQAVSGIPGLGGLLASGFKQIAEAITNACGVIFGGLEHIVGGFFHGLAVALNFTWQIMREGNVVLAHIANVVGDTLYRVTGLHALVRTAERILHTVLHRFVKILRELYNQGLRIKSLEQDWTKGIGHDLIIAEGLLQSEWNTFTTKVLPDLAAGVADIPGELADLKTWVTDNFLANTSDALKAAGIAILAALGLNWLRCDSNLVNKSKNQCGNMGDLSTLLGLFTAAFALANLETIVKEVQKIEVDAVKAMTTIVGVEHDLFG